MGCGSSSVAPVDVLNGPELAKSTLNEPRSKHGSPKKTAKSPLNGHGSPDSVAGAYEYISGTDHVNKGSKPTAKFKDVDELGLRGVSVEYLTTTFKHEVKQNGFDMDSAIHEIEPIVIRGKGEGLTCPRDGRIGTAYVDAIDDELMVGRSTHMLSYTWGYKIGEIIETLAHYCDMKEKNPKKTFVWICCLCINQHRVREMADQEIMIDPEEFFGNFGSRVTNIGHMLSMMSPWDNPKYLRRVWCCFEMHTALQDSSVNFEIIMPPQETASLKDTLCDNFEKILHVISYVDVTEARATVEADRKEIFDYIRSQAGGFRRFNHDVIAALRTWLLDTTHAQLKLHSGSSEQDRTMQDRLKMGAAQLNHDLGDEKHAEELYKEVLIYRTQIMNKQQEGTIDEAVARQAKGHVLNRLAHLHHSRVTAAGDRALYQETLSKVETMYRESLLLYEQSLSYYMNEPKGRKADKEEVLKVKDTTAGALNNLAQFLKAQHRLAESQPLYERARNLYYEINPSSMEMASILNNLAQVDRALGRLGDAEEAIRKSLAITEARVGKDHTGMATKLSNLAEILEERAYELPSKESNALREEAGKLYYRALRIVEKTLGRDHPQVAEALSNLAANLQTQEPKQLDTAENMYRQSLAIDKASFGENTSGVATTLQNLGTCLQLQEKHEAAAESFQDCLRIKKITHAHDPGSVAGTLYSLAVSYHALGNCSQAIDCCKQSIQLFQKSSSVHANSRLEIVHELLAVLSKG